MLERYVDRAAAFAIGSLILIAYAYCFVQSTGLVA